MDWNTTNLVCGISRLRGWISTLAIAVVLLGTSSFAQQPAGTPKTAAPVTPGKQLSPQEIQQLRQRLAQTGRKTTTTFAAPLTARKQKHLEIIAALTKQKETILAQRTAILAAAGKGSLPPGQPGAHYPGVVMQQGRVLMDRTTAGASPGSRANAKTTPSGGASQAGGGGQSIPLSGNAAKALQSSPGAIKQALIYNGLTISTVSGLSNAQGVWFTTDPGFSQFTITGCGFGDQQGSAHLYGPFISHQVNLNIEFWSDTSITGYTDPNVTGEPDQTGTVTLVVAPANGSQVQKTGFNFFAVRDRVQLQVIPRSQMVIARLTDTVGSPVPMSVVSPVQQNSGTPDGMRAAFPGATVEIIRDSGNRFGSATDSIYLYGLAPGFYVDTVGWAHHDMSPADCSGTFYVDGNWNAGWTPPGASEGVMVTTQEEHCHGAVVTPLNPSTTIDGSLSDYAVSVWVVGPKGVNPWPSNLQ